MLAAALCFSTTGTAAALAEVDASPLAVGAARILVGGMILGALALRPGPATLVPVLTRRSALVVALGAAGVLSYQSTFFLGTQLNGVAVGTVVALGSAPVVTGLLEFLLTRRPPSTRWLVATGLAIAGMLLIAGLLAPTQTGGIDPVGVGASIGAGASYAVSTLASKTLLSLEWSPAAAMGAVFGVAGVLSLPVLLAAGTAWLVTPSGLLLAGWLGLVTTALAYLLFGWGLARLPVTTVATLTLAEPLAATLLGLFLLGEEITAVMGAGLGLIALGLAVLAAPVRKEAPVVSAQT